MAVAEILAPLPGERVLDLYASPGGKSTHLAALMQNQGLLVANEIHPKRVWDLAENLERCRCRNAVVANETPDRLAAHLALFDRVLLDAPCSVKACFVNQILRSHWTPGHVRLFSSPAEIFTLRPHGQTRRYADSAHSTCLCPGRKRSVIGHFLREHPTLSLTTHPMHPGFSHGMPAWAATPPVISRETVRVSLAIVGEGHFIARLQRLGHPDPIATYPVSLSITLEQTLLPRLCHHFQDFLSENLTGIDFTAGLLVRLLSVPAPCGLPDLADLKIIHQAGGWGFKRIAEPSHALATRLPVSQHNIPWPDRPSRS
jgi:hypothetical protein